jgi:hypothetical protein
MGAPANLCIDKDGDVVLLVKLWNQRYDRKYLSVYAFTGIKSKRMHLLHRERVGWEDFREHVAINHAHLWAIRNEVAGYKVMTTADKYNLFHPTKEKPSE